MIAVPAEKVVLGVRLGPRPRAVGLRLDEGEVPQPVVHSLGQAAPQVCVDGARSEELARDTHRAARDDVAAIADVGGVKSRVLCGHGGGQ